MALGNRVSVLYVRAVSDFSLEPLVLALAAEFKRRDMRAQLASLRGFFRVYKARKRTLAREARPAWDEDMVITWLCIFRVPPFESAYPVLARGVPCPSCRAEMGDGRRATVRCVFPGGTLRACWSCDARWLEIDPGA